MPPRKISKTKLIKARIVATRSMVAILFVIFGLLISAQWRSIPQRVTNPIAPYTSLKDTKEALYDEQNQLKSEISNLQKLIEQTQKNAEDVSLTKSELSDLKLKKAQAGLYKLNGPGVIITLNDSSRSPATEDSIIHAADIRDILNLLWGSGAEAISVNNQRVVINTAVDCIVNTILINNERLSTPFKIEAIGNQKLMYDKLTSQGNLYDLHQRAANQGITFDLVKNNDITVPAFDGSFEVKNGVAK